MTTDHFDMNTAPMRIGAVRLKVRDLEAVAAFYQRVLGLTPLARGEGHVTLGMEEAPLLHLAGDPALRPRDPRQPGLFHTAFLMPSRADLARWLGFVTEAGVSLQGASDHIVSEAIYLADPEGNEIEVYADRAVAQWHDATGAIHMTTDPLNRQDLLNAAGGAIWTAFPEAGVIGHVHLQIGDTAEAETFYRDALGFDVATRYPGATFFGSGGYHHQLAGNIWNSRGAGHRPEGMAGLDEVEIVARSPSDIADVAARAERAGIAITGSASGTSLHDPWGTAITLTS